MSKCHRRLEIVVGEAIADNIIGKIEEAAQLYHRLLLIVAPTGSGKTSALIEVRSRIHAPIVNINLELSERMLDLTERQRALQLPRLLQDILDNANGDVVLLDNIEMLFHPALKQDPLRLLQGLSRNKTVVAAWSGQIRTEGKGLRTDSTTNDSSLSLVYAIPDHPEYRRYPIRDFLVIDGSHE